MVTTQLRFSLSMPVNKFSSHSALLHTLSWLKTWLNITMLEVIFSFPGQEELCSWNWTPKQYSCNLAYYEQSQNKTKNWQKIIYLVCSLMFAFRKIHQSCGETTTYCSMYCHTYCNLLWVFAQKMSCSINCLVPVYQIFPKVRLDSHPITIIILFLILNAQVILM